jgi:hypothetical protein
MRIAPDSPGYGRDFFWIGVFAGILLGFAYLLELCGLATAAIARALGHAPTGVRFSLVKPPVGAVSNRDFFSNVACIVCQQSWSWFFYCASAM